MTKWQPKETAPRDTLVLCYNPNKDFELLNGIKLESGTPPGISINYGWRRNVTHWMPLPKPPEKKHECFK